MQENISNKTILVAGGAGFIGSHLCEAILAQGHKVIAVDNLFTGQMKNIDRLRPNPNFKFEEIDIVEPFYILNLPRSSAASAQTIYGIQCFVW